MKRLGWVHNGDQGDSHFLLKDWWRGDIDHLIEVAAGYDVLEDLPWPLVYREMADAFPDAKFVLTRRCSTEKWLRSQQSHVAEKGEYGMHRRIYGSANPSADPELYRAFYVRHNEETRAFFGDRLLDVCWEEGDGWSQLCGFLGEPVPRCPFPHSNPTTTKRARRFSLRLRAGA